ncbi:TM141 protein, partial [Nothoprocta ornata]|nr:TM141 protein [Nothoprocta ornata]
AGAAFALQKLLPGRRPGALRWSLLLSAGVGSVASYIVTRAETQKCTDFWVFLETGKSLRERAPDDGMPQPPENLPIPEDGATVAAPLRRNKYGDVVE